MSLLPLRQAAALHDRTYFSAARNLALMRRGTPIVFYESGKANGRCAAIAIARVRSTVAVPKRKIAASLIETGVLDEEEVAEITTGDEVAATTVDNVMKLTKPVTLNRLRELGCIDGSNAVTSRPISALQLQQIIAEGQGEHE
jgi:predicted transcriptional regulator